MNQDVLNVNNIKVGEIELEDFIYSASINEPLMHQVVKMQLAGRRSGTASTKTRAEVRGGGKKPWKQKGTGRARCGSNTSPIWVGGGIIFGPKPRSYAFSIPKKMKKAALRSALSAKMSEGAIFIVNELNFEQPSTKSLVNILQGLDIKGRLLIIADENNINLIKSSRNIPQVKFLPIAGLNVYDILMADKLLIVQPSIDVIKNRLS